MSLFAFRFEGSAPWSPTAAHGGTPISGARLSASCAQRTDECSTPSPPASGPPSFRSSVSAAEEGHGLLVREAARRGCGVVVYNQFCSSILGSVYYRSALLCERMKPAAFVRPEIIFPRRVHAVGEQHHKRGGLSDEETRSSCPACYITNNRWFIHDVPYLSLQKLFSQKVFVVSRSAWSSQ